MDEVAVKAYVKAQVDANPAFAAARGVAHSTPPVAPPTSQDLSQKLIAIKTASVKASQIPPGSTSLGASAFDITRRKHLPHPPLRPLRLLIQFDSTFR